MLAKKIKYEDYNGVKRDDTFYFHLNKAELLKFLAAHGDYTLADELISMIADRDTKSVMDVFDKLIDLSYGKKSVDGIQFQKSPEILAAFKQSEAYSELFMELTTNAKSASDFFNGIIPEKLAKEIQKTITDPEKLPEKYRDLAVMPDA